MNGTVPPAGGIPYREDIHHIFFPAYGYGRGYGGFGEFHMNPAQINAVI
jgi:hypothetical protein